MIERDHEEKPVTRPHIPCKLVYGNRDSFTHLIVIPPNVEWNPLDLIARAFGRRRRGLVLLRLMTFGELKGSRQWTACVEIEPPTSALEARKTRDGWGRQLGS